jgi:hypothetical protein
MRRGRVLLSGDIGGSQRERHLFPKTKFRKESGSKDTFGGWAGQNPAGLLLSASLFSKIQRRQLTNKPNLLLPEGMGFMFSQPSKRSQSSEDSPTYTEK